MGPLSDELRASAAAETPKGSIAATSPARPISAATSPRTTEDSDRGSDADRRSSGRGGSLRLGQDHLGTLMQNNRKWAADRKVQDPTYFDRLCAQQSPEYLWIGCADSRVPANVILGLESGEVFTQRNVGNQASHTDLNVMACLEYAVKELKVKVIICCGHYGCGAVKAALKLPSRAQGLVNCWISDIRECRNQHHAELKALKHEEQVDRLCELNVMRQTFHVCTSPIVQNAWDQGQELAVYGVIYNLKDGLMQRLVGPLTADNECLDVMEYENTMKVEGGVLPTNLADLLPVMMGSVDGRVGRSRSSLLAASLGEDSREEQVILNNTAQLVSKLALHTGWDVGTPGSSSH